MVVACIVEEGRWELLNGYKVSVKQDEKVHDLLYNILTIANNLVLYTYKFIKRVDLMLCGFYYSLKKKEKHLPIPS